MGYSYRELGAQWISKKNYRRAGVSRTWRWERPFFEKVGFESEGVINEKGVLEIYYHVKSRKPVDYAATRKIMARTLSKALGKKRYICVVEGKKPLVTLSFYCRLEEGEEPSAELMNLIPKLIEQSVVLVEDQDLTIEE